MRLLLLDLRFPSSAVASGDDYSDSDPQIA